MKITKQYGIRVTVATMFAAVPLLMAAQSPASQSPSSQSPAAGTSQATHNAGSQMQHDMDNQTQHMDQGAKKMMKSADTSFAMKAAQGGMTEVKAGQLAADKASSPDVKAFGQQMVDDHGKANEQLKSVAQSEGMTLPTDISPKQQAMYDKLSKLSGADFDKAYVKDMLMDHQEDVKEFTKESQSGKDEKIKGFASETLPVIQGHLDKIKGIHSKMMSGSAAGSM